MQSTLTPVRPQLPFVQHRVLVVDDDAISIEILALMLGCDGHEVLQAADAVVAFELLAASTPGGSPDVLLIDLQMPGMTGSELARNIRTLKGAKPRLLAMSATAVDDRSLVGFDGFLLKPLLLEDLRRALAAEAPLSSGNGQTRAARRRSASRTSASKIRKSPLSENPVRENLVIQDSDRSVDLDRSVLMKLSRAMTPLNLQELYAACIADSRMRISILQEQLSAANLEAARRSAHQIKGAASMLGAARLASLAGRLEAGSCKEEDTASLTADLLDACNQLERILLEGKLHVTHLQVNHDDTDC